MPSLTVHSTGLLDFNSGAEPETSILPWVIGDVGDEGFYPNVRFCLSLLVCSHHGILRVQIAAHYMRTRKVIQRSVDVMWCDSRMEFLIDFFIEDDGQLLRHLGFSQVRLS